MDFSSVNSVFREYTPIYAKELEKICERSAGGFSGQKNKFFAACGKNLRWTSDTFYALPAPLAVERCAANRTP